MVEISLRTTVLDRSQSSGFIRLMELEQNIITLLPMGGGEYFYCSNILITSEVIINGLS